MPGRPSAHAPAFQAADLAATGAAPNPDAPPAIRTAIRRVCPSVSRPVYCRATRDQAPSAHARRSAGVLPARGPNDAIANSSLGRRTLSPIPCVSLPFRRRRVVDRACPELRPGEFAVMVGIALGVIFRDER